MLWKIVLSDKILQNTSMVKKLMSHRLKLIGLQEPQSVTGFLKQLFKVVPHVLGKLPLFT